MKDYWEWLLWKVNYKRYCFPCDDIHLFWQHRRNHYQCWRFHEQGRQIVSDIEKFLKEHQ